MRPPPSAAARAPRPAAAAAVATLALAAAAVPTLAGWGMLDAPRAEPPAHATLLDGDGWNALSRREREALVQGFLLGAAAEQAVAGTAAAGQVVTERARPQSDAPAAAAGAEPGGPSAPPGAASGTKERDGGAPEAGEVAASIARLREAGALRFSLAPSMLARRLDEYYWWRNQRATPVAAALVEIHHRLRTEHY